MPPALSDDEQSDEEQYLPVRVGPLSPASVDDVDKDDDDDEVSQVKTANGKKGASAVSDVPDEEDPEDEDDDEEVEEYVVESIKQHMIDDYGNIKFQVKWEGYDSKKDLTWEPEENLADTADEILTEYYRKIGGREAAFDESAKAAKGKKRGRQLGATQKAGAKRSRKNDTHPAASTPPATKKWTPPSGSWEDDIESIDACEEQGSGKLIVYLNWKNGHKTKHDTSIIYKKCPQKMLRFYEKHVRYVKEEKLAAEES